MTTSLETYGWNAWFAERFAAFAEAGHVPARVAVEHRSQYELIAEAGALTGAVAGKLRHGSDRLGRPGVGDWVAITRRGGEATIHGVVERKSAFTRRGSSGRHAGAQVVAANIDIVFVVTSCNLEFNARRLERYLAAAHDSGASPAVVLTKADLPGVPATVVAEARAVAGSAPVLLTSARAGTGIEDVRQMLAGHKTGALLGSSGVGKSTLVNTLAGNTRIATAPVRVSDDRGIHTTTRRELVLLPGGGLLIDTPGMRQIQPDADEAVLLDAFADVRALVDQCAYANCSHGAEPDCAVRQAVADGLLPAARLEAFRELVAEQQHGRAPGKTNRELKAEGRAAAKAGLKKKRGRS